MTKVPEPETQRKILDKRNLSRDARKLVDAMMREDGETDLLKFIAHLVSEGTERYWMDIESLQWGPVEPSCGVYQLRLKGEIQYIGRAKNVKRRVGEHRWEKRIEFDEALFVAVPLDSLLAVERALIWEHNPPFNVNCVYFELRSERLSPNTPKASCRTTHPHQVK